MMLSLGARVCIEAWRGWCTCMYTLDRRAVHCSSLRDSYRMVIWRAEEEGYTRLHVVAPSRLARRRRETGGCISFFSGAWALMCILCFLSPLMRLFDHTCWCTHVPIQRTTHTWAAPF